MPTSVEQINLWRNTPTEHQRLEFKEAKRQFDSRKLYKYCVAIANEGGGNLLLGIEDSPPRRVVGTAAFSNTVATEEKLFEKLGFRTDIEEVAHPDGRVLVFNIPSRPRGTAYQYDGSYLMRSGQRLVAMSEDQLRSIFAEGAPDWLEEPSLTNLSAREVIERLNTETFFEMLGLTYPVNMLAKIERLVQERLVDSDGDRYTIRRLGALLFARRLQDFPDLERKSVRVIVYDGVSKLQTEREQVGKYGYAVGFQRLVKFVMGLLPQNEVIKDAIRREVKLVPEIVIRELVANALIHQDFRISGGSVMIDIYDDRVEISNPGEPIVPVDRFIDGYQSRNEHLADIMRRIGICEERGSGLDKVISAVEL